MRDIWTRKWGLPGGTAKPDESSLITAARETREETGLKLRAEEPYGQTENGFLIYVCTTSNRERFVSKGGFRPVPTAATNEISEILLVICRAVEP